MHLSLISIFTHIVLFFLFVQVRIASFASVMEEERWHTHYSSKQKILLVGEGDFSFSACLARCFASAKNIVATTKYSKEKLRIEHWSSVENLQVLEDLGCNVIHGVDVVNMNEHILLMGKKFDRIVFNFPHAGHDPLYRERDYELIRRHKKLMTSFFMNASKMLEDGGEVHVSHRDDYPYVVWDIVNLAKDEGLVLIEKSVFKKEDYPGYENKRGGNIRSNETFPLGNCFTFKFRVVKSSDLWDNDFFLIPFYL